MFLFLLVVEPDALSTCAEQVNEGVREQENSDRLEWIQNHVQCDGPAEVSIIDGLKSLFTLGRRERVVFVASFCIVLSSNSLLGCLD